MLFSKIGGKPKDLFGKKFNSGISFTQTSNTSDGVQFKAKGSGDLKTGPFTKGTFNSTFPHPEVGKIALEANTSGDGSIKVTNKKLMKGLVASAKVSAKPSLNVNAEFVKDKLAFTAAVNTALLAGYATNVELSAATGVSNFTVGGNVKYNANGDKAGVSDYGVAIEGVSGPIVGALTTKKKLSAFTARALYKHDSKAQFGVEVEYTLPKKDGKDSRPYNVQVGAQQKIDDSTTVKVKADVLDGDVTASIEQSLKEPKVQIGSMVSVNAKSGSFAATKWGLWFSVGDY